MRIRKNERERERENKGLEKVPSVFLMTSVLWMRVHWPFSMLLRWISNQGSDLPNKSFLSRCDPVNRKLERRNHDERRAGQCH
jgi:GTPase SAR1 family protein